MKHARSRAREAALKVLYQLDLLGRLSSPEAACELLDQEELREEARRYALDLLRGCVEHLPILDSRIRNALKRWKLDRLAVLDRCLLRLGAFEILFLKEVPPKVSINEAIELAKKYSTEQSGSFINGILDYIHHEHASCGPPSGEGESERTPGEDGAPAEPNAHREER